MTILLLILLTLLSLNAIIIRVRLFDDPIDELLNIEVMSAVIHYKYQLFYKLHYFGLQLQLKSSYLMT